MNDTYRNGIAVAPHAAAAEAAAHIMREGGNAIEAMVTRLRKKTAPESIQTRRGFGYLLEDTPG